MYECMLHGCAEMRPCSLYKYHSEIVSTLTKSPLPKARIIVLPTTTVIFSRLKIGILLHVLLCSIVEYFYEL